MVRTYGHLTIVGIGGGADPDEVRDWQEVARLTRLGIDDELLALLTADFIPPVPASYTFRGA